MGEVIRVEAEAQRDDPEAENIGKRWFPPGKSSRTIRAFSAMGFCRATRRILRAVASALYFWAILPPVLPCRA